MNPREEIFTGGIPYRNKMLLSKLKKFDSFHHNAYVTGVSKTLPDREEFFNDLLQYTPGNLLVSVRDDYILKIDMKKLDPRVILLTDHPRDFHKLFDTYIYVRGGYFDPHPRLLIECVYYEKKIIVLDEDSSNNHSYDGGSYRLELLNGCTRKMILDMFDLTQNDCTIKMVRDLHGLQN